MIVSPFKHTTTGKKYIFAWLWVEDDLIGTYTWISVPLYP